MFDPIEDVIAAIGRGELVIVTDDEGRENEGDLIGAGAFADAAMLNFMVTHARGLLCAPLSAEYAARLGLAEPAGKHDPRHTAFTQSVDAVEGTTTGVSAFDRARTVARLVDPASTLEDFYSPGHLFPLIARPGGVLERRPYRGERRYGGARRLPPVAVLCEILKDDGTMARVPDLELYAKKHHLKMGSVADLIAYRRRLNCVCA